MSSVSTGSAADRPAVKVASRDERPRVRDSIYPRTEHLETMLFTRTESRKDVDRRGIFQERSETRARAPIRRCLPHLCSRRAT